MAGKGPACLASLDLRPLAKNSSIAGGPGSASGNARHRMHNAPYGPGCQAANLSPIVSGATLVKAIASAG